MNQNLHTPKQHKWLHKLFGYDFKIQYKPGGENVAVDALSRCFLVAWSNPKLEWLQTLKVELQRNDHLGKILQQCITNSQTDSNYSC